MSGCTAWQGLHVAAPCRPCGGRAGGPCPCDHASGMGAYLRCRHWLDCMHTEPEARLPASLPVAARPFYRELAKISFFLAGFCFKTKEQHIRPPQVMLVASHPWDVQGALQARRHAAPAARGTRWHRAAQGRRAAVGPGPWSCWPGGVPGRLLAKTWQAWRGGQLGRKVGRQRSGLAGQLVRKAPNDRRLPHAPTCRLACRRRTCSARRVSPTASRRGAGSPAWWSLTLQSLPRPWRRCSQHASEFLFLS